MNYNLSFGPADPDGQGETAQLEEDVQEPEEVEQPGRKRRGSPYSGPSRRRRAAQSK